MSEEIKRHRLDAAPAAVLALLPEMDRLMVIVRSGGSLHERIGPVERVVREKDLLRIEGACHDSEIRLPLIKAVDFDTSSVMKDKVYPRLDFLGSDGEVLFSVTGMEGEAPFAAALAAFPRLPSLRPEHPGTPAGPETTEEGDAGGAFWRV
ncbi:ChuX/HutX family heme-like substrate-binding protein [Pannonibacter sp. Pt2-lr]